MLRPLFFLVLLVILYFVQCESVSVNQGIDDSLASTNRKLVSQCWIPVCANIHNSCTLADMTLFTGYDIIHWFEGKTQTGKLLQSTVRITTLGGGASEKCPYSRKCPYTRSLIILCVTVRWDFALGMEILSLFANCRHIRSRHKRS